MEYAYDEILADKRYPVQWAKIMHLVQRRNTTIGIPVYVWKEGVREPRPLVKYLHVPISVMKEPYLTGGLIQQYVRSHYTSRQKYYELYSHLKHELEIAGIVVDLATQRVKGSAAEPLSVRTQIQPEIKKPIAESEAVEQNTPVPKSFLEEQSYQEWVKRIEGYKASCINETAVAACDTLIKY